MTHEKAKWIRRMFVLFAIALIIAIVFAPQKKKSGAGGKAGAKGSQTTATTEGAGSEVIKFDDPGSLKDGQIAEILSEASRKHGSVVVGIVHCHVPGKPESEQIADILVRVARKYGAQVQVIQVNIVACPELAKAEKVTKPPKVVMIAGTERVCKFQGVWTQAQIELKVEEILRGLKRMGKDWRPAVPGMKPMGDSGASPP